MIDPYKSKALINLKKASGQINRIIRMIDEEKYCIDIAQQVNAAMGLLKKTNTYILESHLKTCCSKKLASGPTAAKKAFAEVLQVFDITSR